MNKDLAYIHIHDSKSEINIHILPEMSSIHPKLLLILFSFGSQPIV